MEAGNGRPRPGNPGGRAPRRTGCPIPFARPESGRRQGFPGKRAWGKVPDLPGTRRRCAPCRVRPTAGRSRGTIRPAGRAGIGKSALAGCPFPTRRPGPGSRTVFPGSSAILRRPGRGPRLPAMRPGTAAAVPRARSGIPGGTSCASGAAGFPDWPHRRLRFPWRLR